MIKKRLHRGYAYIRLTKEPFFDAIVPLLHYNSATFIMQ